MNAIDKLIKEIIRKKSPCVIGLDPRIKDIPGFLKKGNDVKDICKAILNFNKKIINAVKDVVPAVKPQIAFYEQYGYAGIKVFQETVNYAKKKGLMVIADVKRNDIASTAEAYAKAYLSKKIFEVDFITVNPYLGSDGINPFIEMCKKYGKGIFVLCKTSNPSSKEIQDKRIGKKYVYEVVGELINEWGKELIGKYGYSSVGAVVGATYPKQAERLRKLLKHVFFLVPGYGAQGGKARDVVACFDEKGLGAIINSSRSIIFAYKKGFPEEEFDKAAREAALNMREDILSALEKHGKLSIWWEG